jgi:predicted P-loop ATPase
MKALLDVRYVTFSSRKHEVTSPKLADDRFHPIRDYLDALPAWDGQKRVETYSAAPQADDTPYVRASSRKTLRQRARSISASNSTAFLCSTARRALAKAAVQNLEGDEFYSETLSLTDMDDNRREKLQLQGRRDRRARRLKRPTSKR